MLREKGDEPGTSLRVKGGWCRRVQEGVKGERVTNQASRSHRHPPRERPLARSRLLLCSRVMKCEGVCVCVCACMCARERESVCVRERESVCVRERERKSV